MGMHNVATIRYVRIPKVHTIVAVDRDLTETHRRRIANRWKEFVRMERFAIEMLRYVVG